MENILEKMWTVEEIAQLFKVEVRTIQRFIREGKIKGFRIGKEYRVKESALKKFVKAQQEEDNEGE